ncbi:plant virulence effector HPE1-like domain-containing protein [Rhizobium alvei]|uniref:Plant virulence effector HPE1-like domain-containing protein n=1 Tax=Rhizobium alvei TaxID=1132659 RepID=A0ABT8YG61_9HYPH|nr:plant virulence effector HPE1-like domain-containing protein [Rhizobium alvei]MDO6962659.1 plant virulence effector HPE1-like domain-containing protein [Rhizobium alvei]
MRLIVWTGLAIALGGPAFAQPQERGNLAPDSSIETITCSACAPLEEKKPEGVPEIVLAPGTQKVETREINGELKVFRTEAWLGGSPVTYVSKAPPAMQAEFEDERAKENAAAHPADNAPADAAQVNDGDAIDINAKTSAVAATPPEAGKEIKVEAPKAAMFDPSKLELRLN